MPETNSNKSEANAPVKKPEGVPFVIPVLPLQNTTLFPETMVPLSVGRPGSMAAVEAALAGEEKLLACISVRPERNAAAVAEQEKVDIRLHTIIYNLTDEIKKAMTGLLSPVFKEIYKGKAEVRETFRVSKVGAVAGCVVLDGILTRSSEARVQNALDGYAPASSKSSSEIHSSAPTTSSLVQPPGSVTEHTTLHLKSELENRER